MLYLTCFLVSIFLIYREDVTARRVYGVLTSGILIILAALRDEKVGYDVMIYQKAMFSIAKKSTSIISYYQNRMISSMEPLYSLVTYVASRLGNISSLFLINETIIVVFTLITLRNMRDYAEPHISFACFVFQYYLRGYDTVRQSMAQAIVFYAYSLYEKKKHIPCIIFMVIAIGFHYSAVVGFGIILIKKLCDGQLKKVWTLIISMCTFILCFAFRYIFIWVVNTFSFLPAKYISARYLFIEGGKIDFSVTKFLYVLFAFIILVIYGKRREDQSTNNTSLYIANKCIENYDFLFIMMAFSLGGVIIASQANFAHRVFYYPEMFSMVIIPNFVKIFKKDSLNRYLASIFLYIFLVAYCVEYFMVLNIGKTYPYILNKNIF